jgi:hypothetical protein
VAEVLLPPVYAMSAGEFLQTFREFVGRQGRPTDQSPWTIVEQWESLVDQAVEGYHWGLYEFTNGLSIRDLLEKALHADKLARFSQIEIMRQRVNNSDLRLKGMFLSDVEIGDDDTPWWRRGILATASDEYLDDVQRLHGIETRR